jgi:hypothetical protein
MNKIDGQLLSLWIESKRSSIEWKMSMGLILDVAGKAQLQMLQELVEIFEVKTKSKTKQPAL